MIKPLSLLACAAVFPALLSAATPDVYADFPITLKDYEGSKTNSVSYTGQIARHLLHNSLKTLAASGTGAANPALEAEMLAYFAGTEDGRAIIDPKTKGAFVISQALIEDVSAGKALKDKAYGGQIDGWPGQMTGAETLEFMIKKAAAAEKGYDVLYGYDYSQLISKFAMGAVFYNQAVDNYLDERLGADRNPNGKAYKEGTQYTGKEHVWDEAFGYFGAPAHALTLEAATVYSIAKLDAAVFDQADYNGDGLIDLVTEMTYAHAYYAADADKSGRTDYLHSIVSSFLEGRQLITKARGKDLSDKKRRQLQAIAADIKTDWQKVIAEAAFKYAGSVYTDANALQEAVDSGADASDLFRTYAKHWGELKGFALALQVGGEDLGNVAVQLNRLIGYSPVLLGDTQVIGIDAAGEYVQASSISLKEYALNMIRLQQLLAEEFSLAALKNDITGDMTKLLEQIQSAPSAEND